MAAKTDSVKKTNFLQKTINEIKSVTHAERDLYAYIRDLLTNPVLGLNWKRENIVIDSSVGSGIPDVVVYPNGLNGKPNKAPYNAAIIFEGKTSDQVRQKANLIFNEKKKYIQLATRWMVLFDQTMIRFVGIGSGRWDETYDYDWTDLVEPNKFKEAFDRISSDVFNIAKELELFRKGETEFAWIDVNFIGTDKFLNVIKEISKLLREQIGRLVTKKAVEDIKSVLAELANASSLYGACEFVPAGRDIKMVFPDVSKLAAKIDDPSDKIRFVDEYDRMQEKISILTEPYKWALKIEHLLLKEYADKIGMEAPSLLSSSEENKKVRESFIYETASFILARMLLIRFSEDNNFLERYVSNGGITDFVVFARRFRQGYQFLLKEAYKHAAELYRNLFDESSLDWILDVKDPALNSTIEYCLYLLSEFDFKTVKGDILSGVYDGFLEKSKRKALGEYYTRPEVARYILNRCGYDFSKTLLDAAVGTGTFAVEALNYSIESMRVAGMLDKETISAILDRLNGLDINVFAIALAQVQFFWHLFELFQGKTKDEMRLLASSLIPAINLCGGQSSLDTAGILFNGQDGFAFMEYDNANDHTRYNPKWLRIMRQSYDICAGNPPWIRAHRIKLPKNLEKHYADVYEKQIDLSGLFLFKALRQWVKPGGFAGFILPYSTLESDSAQKLRNFLKTKTIVEIVDMEHVAPRVFDADTVPIILIVKNETPPEDHQVRITVLTDDAYNEMDNIIDFTRAIVVNMNLKDLLTSSYRNTTTERISPKIYAEDVDILNKIGNNPRIASIVRKLWVNKRDSKDVIVFNSMSSPQGYREHTLIQRGIEIGGTQGLSENGLPIYKGSNVFPANILGDPLGYWNKDDNIVSSINIFKYLDFFTEDVYVTRRLSQVPVAGRWNAETVFNDTTHIIVFEKPFPLNIYLLSRIPQYFAFKTLRTEVMLRRRAVWNVAEIHNLPVPENIDVQEIEAIGSRIFSYSNDIINRYRHVEQMIENSVTHTLRDCIINNKIALDKINLTVFPENIKVRSDEIICRDNRITSGLFMDIYVPDDLLYKYLSYCVAEALSDNEYTDREAFLNIPVPIENLREVVDAIKDANLNNAEVNYKHEIELLDFIVGKALGLDDAEIGYIIKQFSEDPFLKRISPNMPHLGMKFQAYRSNYGRDGQRYL